MNFPTTFFGWVAFLAEKYGPDFMRGLGVTLQLATIGTVLGCVLGFVVGMVRSVDTVSYTHLDVYKRQVLIPTIRSWQRHWRNGPSSCSPVCFREFIRL